MCRRWRSGKCVFSFCMTPMPLTDNSRLPARLPSRQPTCRINGELVMRAYTPSSSDDELGYFELVVSGRCLI